MHDSTHTEASSSANDLAIFLQLRPSPEHACLGSPADDLDLLAPKQCPAVHAHVWSDCMAMLLQVLCRPSPEALFQ